MRRKFSLAEVVLYLSLALISVFLVVARPPTPSLALYLAPIALAAVLYEFAGGTLAALVAMVGVALLLALDPDLYRRGTILREAMPILVSYLAVGPVVGWLVTRERERERQLGNTSRRLQIVQEIVQTINSALDPQDTLKAIVAETQRLVPFDRAAIMLKVGTILRVVATSEGDPNQSALVGQAFDLNDSAAGKAIQKKEILTIYPGQIGEYADTRLLCPEGRSCLIVPIQFQQAVVGSFVLIGKDLAGIAEVDRRNLVQIVDQTAIAIEHARLHRLERDRARALAAISEAGQQIAAMHDRDRTLQLVMSKAAETLPMDAGALFLFDETSQVYRVAVSHNLPSEQVDKITFAFDEGVPGWVVKQRQPLIIADARQDERVHPHVVEAGIQSVLAVPLITREQLVGVLNLFCQTGTNAFDEEALRLAQVYADQAAVFIENARLLEELRRAAAELEVRVEQRTQELRETQAQVIRAEKMAAVGRLAASVAHEVNNPLQAIALHLQLVGDEGMSEVGEEQVAIVQQELARIAEIVQRLLEFQRPKDGRRSQQQIPALLKDVLALAGRQLEQSGVIVTCYMERDLAPVLAVGDQLNQVFLNLVLNAVEAMPDGGELRIHGSQSHGQVVVIFADSGRGIDAEIMPQLFEPFFSTKHTGTGLGLAVSQDIITNHGGTLEASSLPDRGAVFTVRLPIIEDAVLLKEVQYVD